MQKTIVIGLIAYVLVISITIITQQDKTIIVQATVYDYDQSDLAQPRTLGYYLTSEGNTSFMWLIIIGMVVLLFLVMKRFFK